MHALAHVGELRDLSNEVIAQIRSRRLEADSNATTVVRESFALRAQTLPDLAPLETAQRRLTELTASPVAEKPGARG